MKNTAEKVRVFIGTEPRTEIARRVLECSIMRRTEMAVEFVPMIGRAWEYSTGGFEQGTGFSLRRWMIPEFCNFQGRAIYMDADQLVLGDVWDLWTKPEQCPPAGPGCSVWCTYQKVKSAPDRPTPQTSVMVIDCTAARTQWGWYIKQALHHLRGNPTRDAYLAFMRGDWLPDQPTRIETGWNHLDTFVAGETRLIHYTREPDQPWYNPEHPLARHWKMELSVAVANEFVTEKAIDEAIGKYRKQDARHRSDGLHPDYGRFRPSRKGKPNRPDSKPRIPA